MTHLECSSIWTGNYIFDVSPGLSQMTQLQTLHLVGNRIADLNPLSTLTNLKWLYLSGNGLSDVSPLEPP